jgi:hypothetical protein
VARDTELPCSVKGVDYFNKAHVTIPEEKLYTAEFVKVAGTNKAVYEL